MSTEPARAPYFSRKSGWLVAQSEWATAIERLRGDGSPLFELADSNPTHAELAYPSLALAEVERRSHSVRYEPQPLGLLAAREALAATLAPSHDPHRICLAASTSELYRYLFDLLTDVGDNLLVPAPGYPLFDVLADLSGLELRYYPLLESDDWTIDHDALRMAIDERTRAIIVVCPNNPTGSYLDDDWAALLETCRQHGLALISDEVFFPYRLRGGSPRPLLTAAADEGVLHVSLGGLSKYAGLPGAKLAWAFIGGPKTWCDAATSRLETIADSFLSPSTSVQRALPELLALAPEIQQTIRGRCLENLSRLGELAHEAISWPHPAGGWSVLLKPPQVRSDDEWASLLAARKRVVVQPGSLYRFPDQRFLVASLLTPPGVWSEGIARLSELVEELS